MDDVATIVALSIAEHAESLSGLRLSKLDVQSFFWDRFASWWILDRGVFVDENPLTSMGKIGKMNLPGELRPDRRMTAANLRRSQPFS
ncbi:hypothetical protein [Rhodococcus koreensis]